MTGGRSRRFSRPSCAAGMMMSVTITLLNPDPRQQPAVNFVIAAGAEAGFVRSEESRQLRDLFRRSHALERVRISETLDRFFSRQFRREVSSRALQHWGENRSRADRIHADVILRVVQRKRPGQRVHRAFGGRVSRNPALAGVSLDGCENNDAAPSALLHLRNAEVRRQVGAIDVHRHAAVPSLGVGFECRAERMNGRRVSQYVESAESENSLFDQSFYIGGLRYVTTLHFQAKAPCFCVSRQLRIGGSFNAAGHHLGSSLRQSLGDGFSNSGSAGYDCDLSLKLLHDPLLSICNFKSPVWGSRA